MPAFVGTTKEGVMVRTDRIVPDPGRAVEALFACAMDWGGHDNVSLLIVRAAT
jgi:hypothetical protein